MRFCADLHIHSYLSRATSKDLNLEQLYRFAQLKGVGVVATGDFTHPRWFAELSDKLVPAEPGLFALRPELARAVDEQVPAACRGQVRFLLSVEISSIYKRGDKVRKVHNLVYAPDLPTAAAIASRLGRLGNIESDGRPILGLDSRDLLEIVIEASSDAFLIPAHIWTPWFSMLGAKSGFDTLEGCYGDLASHIFAAETGLSSDPAMNWRLSMLDRLALVSNSDAHSPEKLGREANLFDCELSYFALRDALRERDGRFLGTVEFFPEEGKYHFDGHRKCGVVLGPEEARARGGLCPQCGKPLTEGVMRRVTQLADREEGFRPEGARPFRSLAPLAEVLAELLDTGPGSQRVLQARGRLFDRIGPELTVLAEVPIEDLGRLGPPLLDEAVRRMRAGQVHVRPGYDGEYGVVRVFEEEELRQLLAQRSFGFQLPSAVPPASRFPEPPPRLAVSEAEPGDASPVPGFTAEQLHVVEHGEGPLLVIAGPGTGKTRTIAHRIARLVSERHVSPRAITAITFTRKAAWELHERLTALLGEAGGLVTATTFHAFGLELLRAFPEQAGLGREFQVLDEEARERSVRTAAEAAGVPVKAASEGVSWAKAHLESPATCAPEMAAVFEAYERLLAEANAVDFDDLVVRAVRLLEASPEALVWGQERCRYLFVDEYQDVSAGQYRMVRLLTAAEASPDLCAVGDPDQAIYGFRGADPSYFARFGEDYPTVTRVTLSQSFRCPPAVVRAATRVIEQSPGRAMRPLTPLGAASTLIDHVVAASAAEEARFIATEIERAIGGTSLYSMDSGRADGESSLAFHDIAVLYRTAAQADAIAEAFDRAGIPFSQVKPRSLSMRPAVKKLLAALREAGAGRSVVERIEEFTRPERGEEEARRTAELLMLLAAPYGENARAFVDSIELMHEADVVPEPQRVGLLTLHASKGLEFPLVFIAGCEDGLLPLRLPGLRVDVEEERRLLYVGMTRSRRRLVLTGARQRVVFGRVVENPTCPFLAAAAPELREIELRSARSPRTRQLPLL